MIPSTLSEVFAYLESFANLERGDFKPREFRLDRMIRLVADFSEPQHVVPYIHLAGSKGKGSTAAYLEAGLRASGKTTGLYASPHVKSYGERIRINGRPLSEELALRCIAPIYEYCEKRREHPDAHRELPTTFELLTLLAFLCFRQARVDVAVLETGLGGRLDATNVVRPIASVLTPIELEHTEYLGDTIAAIAGEKAGIIKTGVPVYTAKQKPEAREVFERVARERECRLTALENRAEIEAGWDGPVYRADIRIDGEAPLPLDLAMPGAVQADNATLALLVLRDIIGPLSPSLVSAVGAASLPGRFELIEGDPPMILDVAHTPVSVAAVIDTYRRRFSASPVVIFGAVRGKRIEEMASLIRDLTADVVVTRPGTFKKSDPEAIAEHFRDHGHTVVFEEDADAALRAARSIATNNRPILVVGSFYLVGLIASRLEAQA